nr:leucine-rich repeat-containing protein [Tanacetum cinerariifolium]
MDTMTGFQNNSGLCGMQIEFLCPEAIIPSERRDEEHEDLSRDFWEGTWIGFPNRIVFMNTLSIGSLEVIESLDLSHNKISGSIPQSMVQLQELTTLDMSNNRLTGRIPTGGQMDTMTGFQNNSGLCGMQTEFLCPEAIIPSERRDEEHEDLSRIFWEGTWIGFPVGFFISILIMGYFLNFLQLFKIW